MSNCSAEMRAELMTEPTITQADREAAASAAVLVEMRELILAGKADHHAKPWAKHREDALAQLVASKSCTCRRCVASLARSLAGAQPPGTPDHYWYRQGKDDGAQSERERIIEWLRADGFLAAADAIERGDHLK